MTPTQRPPDNAPFSPTERVESLHRSGPPGPDPGGSAGGRRLVIGLLLLSVTLVSAGVGFMLSGGRLPASSDSSSPALTPTAQIAAQPTAPPAVQPTLQPTVPPTPQPAATTAPVAAAPPEPTQAPATPTTAAKPTTPPPTTSAPPTSAPAAKPTSAPPTSAPAAQAPKPTTPPAPKPTAPGTDPRLPQIEGRIREYFAALNAEDYARAHQVCCTDAWRSRYPLAQWERNFDGVSNLEMEGEPRYRRVEADLIEVDTDYTFVSGGRQRDFTLRWTFQPVGPAGDEWQAELAEAFGR